MENEIDNKLKELKIYLLGGYRVYIGTRDIGQETWRRRKTQSLVKLLALTPNHRLHKEQLIEFLWPDLDLTAADNNLRQVLFLARKLFNRAGLPSSNVLRLSESWIELYPDGILWVDVEQFERAGAEAKRKKTAEAYRSALALYIGDLLPDDRYEDWTSERREYLRALHRQLLIDTARLYESNQEYKNAIESFLQLITIEPADEESHLALVRIYALMGWRSQAIRQFQSLQKTLKIELNVDPDPASLQLYEAILANRFPGTEYRIAQTSPSTQEFPSHNLPSQLTSFIGRKFEIQEISSILSTDCGLSGYRLLTLIGPGGCGKTRLAIQIAQNLVNHYLNGTWFVELAGVTNGEFVPHIVASTLGIREEPGSPVVETLMNSLRSRCMLVVLDNCEHLIDACSSLANRLLSGCSQLIILATSRQALGIHGEAVWRLSGLSLVDHPSHSPPLTIPQDSEAIQLFVERARLLQPDFHLDETNAQAVNTICRRLDSLPLAIELAAARLNVLSPNQIADRLDDCFRLLSNGSRQTIQRHRSLHAVIDWSCNSLSPSERSLFFRLSVFRGGWSLEAAEAVTAGDDLPAGTLLELLSALVDKSLILSEISRDGDLRYRILETIREYAWECLQATNESAILRRRHAHYFVTLTEQAEPMLRSAEQITWFPRLDLEHENIRAALEFASVSDAEAGLRLAGALWYYWFVRASWAEGRQWLEKVINASVDDSPNFRARKAFALACLAYLLIYIEEKQLAQERLEESLKLSAGLKELSIFAFGLKVKEFLLRRTGNFQAAEPVAKQCVEIYQRLDQPWGIAGGLYGLGVIADMYWHNTADAHQYLTDSLNWYLKSGDQRGCSYALNNLGNLAYKSGDFKTAIENYRKCLSISVELGDRMGAAIWLNNLGLLEVQLGNFSQARQYLLEGIQISKSIGHGWGMASMLLTLGDLIRYEGDLDLAYQKYQEGLKISRQLDDQMLIATALRGIGDTELQRGRLSIAEDFQRDALAILRQTPNLYEEIPPTIESLAAVMLAQKHFERATRLYGAAQATRNSLPRARMPIEQQEFNENQANLQLQLKEAAYSTAWMEGLAMNIEQTILFALSTPSREI